MIWPCGYLRDWAYGCRLVRVLLAYVLCPVFGVWQDCLVYKVELVGGKGGLSKQAKYLLNACACTCTGAGTWVCGYVL